jgi:hypothetical protein
VSLALALALTTCKTTHMTDSKSVASSYDRDYFLAQAARLQATPACEGDAPAGELALTLDTQEAVATARAGDLLRYVAAGKYSEEFAALASATDLQWLAAFGDHQRPYQAADQASILQPACKAPITTMLDFVDMQALMQLLHQQPTQGEAASPLAEKTIISLCTQALGQDYAAAQAIYIGNWSPQATPSGPGYALDAWQLQRIDPDQRWILYRVSLQLHYTPAGQLDHASIYQHPVAGKYQHHQEYLATLAWDADGFHAIHLSLEPDEDEGKGFLRGIKYWKG